ncbi:hypothetical protein MGEO_11465 [Marivita geojedonensis]|uniref:Uncharacterized protein n=2 Tax=Marivita geojedonensis TaxID=1123756 RepID=A0A1X4NK12_9RHOB|nr:hypothetical protein MGEO_11465 [Marivita geojedonensis]PRY76784.1 hypothetical protein CLV76_110107 [Marivita geojedonensis]
MHPVHGAPDGVALVLTRALLSWDDKGGTPIQESTMRQTFPIPSHRSTAVDTVRHLDEAWAYYTPRPKLVTERNSQPSPVFEEYYAA